jgi:branched-chain amino acid aminotransferase
MYAFVNSEIVPLEKAFLHVSDLSIQRGYGIFDFFKISEQHAYFLNDYLDRFYQSASILRLPVPLEREKLIDTIYALIEKNNVRESGMKMILTGGYSPDGYQPHHPNLIITQQALSLPQQDQLDTGVSIITNEYVREIPGVKTINYTMGIWLAEKVKNYNAYDVL